LAKKAPGLKLAVTAGIGSDHVDLEAAIERGITVAEITYSNSISPRVCHVSTKRPSR
jgi:formate dehydrogenase